MNSHVQEPFKTFCLAVKRVLEAFIDYLFIMISAFTLLSGCENPITSYGPQPNYIDKSEHEPFLNIFGVIRPGVTDGKSLSFVHLEKSFEPTSSWPDTFEITDADVSLLVFEGSDIVDSLKFHYSNFDSTFSKNEYRNPEYFPESGQTYGIACSKPGYPVLTSSTTIPNVPTIVDNVINVEQHQLNFTIQRDALAALYDIELQVGETNFSTQVNRPESGNTYVELVFNRNAEAEGKLVIYAYDLNLTEYMTYNLTIKPNTYQPPYSTVDNGYGCFGSLNILELLLNFDRSF